MNYLTVLIAFFSGFALGQEPVNSVRPGIQISSVISSDKDHGINPALTLSFRRLMFSVGPRFAFDRMFHGKPEFYKNSKQLIIDASFRYYLMSEEKRVRLFAQLGAEFKYSSAVYDYYYDNNVFYAYGPVFDHSFRGQRHEKRSFVSIYSGVGVDFKVWKQLTVLTSFGGGAAFSNAESKIFNSESGILEYSNVKKQNGDFVWIISAGLGYCF